MKIDEILASLIFDPFDEDQKFEIRREDWKHAPHRRYIEVREDRMLMHDDRITSWIPEMEDLMAKDWELEPREWWT